MSEKYMIIKGGKGKEDIYLTKEEWSDRCKKEEIEHQQYLQEKWRKEKERELLKEKKMEEYRDMSFNVSNPKELRSHLERLRKDTLLRKSNTEFSIPTPNKVGKELTCNLHTHQGGFRKGGFLPTGTELSIQYYEEDDKRVGIATLNFMIKNHWKEVMSLNWRERESG